MSAIWTVPTSWAWAKFSETVDISQNLVQPDEVPELPHIAPNHIEPKTGRLLEFQTVAEDEVISAKQRFFPGQIVFSKIRPYLRKSALVDFDGVCSADMYPLTPTEAIDRKYLLAWLLSEDFRDEAMEHQGRTLLPKLNQTGLNKTRIPIPPLPEQRRIVAKLDRFSARSAAARDHLARTTKLTTRAKQAILSEAFRGELLGLEPVNTPMFNGRCWDLPDGWRWARFEDVAAIRSNLRPPSEMPDLPHVAPDNIEAGTGRLLPYNAIAEDGVKSGKHKFFAGQIIYSKIRPYLRKAVIVDFDGACSADMYPVECGPELDVHFLHRWLISEDFAWFTAEHEGRSVLPKINQKALNASPVPVPPPEHQETLVRHIEAAFARIDRMTEEASRATHLLDRLDERLLAKAFRGELVPQNPEDEPAEALLTRIRESRAAAPQAKRRRRRKAET